MILWLNYLVFKLAERFSWQFELYYPCFPSMWIKLNLEVVLLEHRIMVGQWCVFHIS